LSDITYEIIVRATACPTVVPGILVRLRPTPLKAVAVIVPELEVKFPVTVTSADEIAPVELRDPSPESVFPAGIVAP
tara:strand:- start:78 stop:308 length:231 start_codon:yes stop_codon:yes gene_type:complete